MLGKQAASQRGRVVKDTCNADCLVGQRSGTRTIGRHRVLQLAGERSGHLCLQRRAGALEGVAGAAKHLDEIAAGHGEARVQPVQAECYRAEELSLAGGGGAGPRGLQQCPRLDSVAAAQPEFGFVCEQPDQHGLRQRLAASGDRGPQPSEVAGGLDEGKPHGVGPRRGLRPENGGCCVGRRNGGGEVVRQLGREDRAAALVAAQQRGRDPVVQLQPARRREPGVEGLSIQVVDEPGAMVWVAGRGEDAGSDGLLGQRRDLGGVKAGHLGEHVG